MKKVFHFAVALTVLVLSVLAVSGYAEDNAGKLLAEEFFSPVPARGYGTQRVLVAGASDAAASILRQGVIYHQQEDYGLALMSLRAYLEESPVQEDHLALLLAATAAIATGYYTEARGFLDAVPRSGTAVHRDYLWYSALLDLRQEDTASARKQLERLDALGKTDYAVKALLGRLP